LTGLNFPVRQRITNPLSLSLNQHWQKNNASKKNHPAIDSQNSQVRAFGDGRNDRDNCDGIFICARIRLCSDSFGFMLSCVRCKQGSQQQARPVQLKSKAGFRRLAVLFGCF